MPVATKGGSIGLNPTVQVSHRLLGEPSAIELAGIIASLGLAQNFAALKALVTTGIQAGHMKLQARSLALLAGAKEEEVPRLVNQLLENKPFNLEKAQTLLQELRNKELRRRLVLLCLKRFSYCFKNGQLGMFLGIEHHFDKSPYLDGKEQSDEKINPMVCFIKRRVP